MTVYPLANVSNYFGIFSPFMLFHSTGYFEGLTLKMFVKIKKEKTTIYANQLQKFKYNKVIICLHSIKTLTVLFDRVTSAEINFYPTNWAGSTDYEILHKSKTIFAVR